MKKVLVIPLLCCVLSASAQTQFHRTVKIEFEKTMNIHAYYKDVAEGEPARKTG
jgi:hypothetical protein